MNDLANIKLTLSGAQSTRYKKPPVGNETIAKSGAVNYY